MQVRAELTAAAPSGPGRPSRLTRRLDGAPLAWRSTPDGVYLVGTAATPVGDDAVEIDVVVEAGATLVVRSAAATVAWSASGTEQAVTATVADGGMLDWRLQPLVATAGCRHRQQVGVRLEGTGALRWTEEILLGRCRERPGRLDLRLDVDLDGEALLRHQLTVGPGASGWDGPAVLGDHRAVGLILRAGRRSALVDTGPGESVPGEARPGDPQRGDDARVAGAGVGEGWAVLELDGPAALVTAVAADLPTLRRAMQQAAYHIG